MIPKTYLIGFLILALCVSLPAAQISDAQGAAIAGACIDPDGKPLGFTRIGLYDAAEREVASVVAAGNGTFVFQGLPPGRYYLLFSRLGVAAAWYGGEARTPVVAGSSKVDVTFSYPRGQSLSGQYTDADGNPLGSCIVSLLDTYERQVARVTTAANGSFAFSGVRPGTYGLRFSRPGAPDVWYGTRGEPAVRVSGEPVSLSFTHPGGFRICGSCSGPDGKPMGFSRISLFDSAERDVASVVAAGNGSFAFTGLRPGAYYIKLSRSGMSDVWYGDPSRRAVLVGEAPAVEVCLRGR